MTESRKMSPSELRANAGFADPSVLLMSLVELTGDVGHLDEFGPLLQHPPKPKVRGRLPVAQLEEAAFARLVDRLALAVEEAGTDVVRPSADDETIARMAGLLTGYEVPLRYAKPIRDQAGLAPAPAVVPRVSPVPPDFKVAVLGAGMTGLAMALRLSQEGIDYTVIEKSSGVGGVWQTNTYPGAAVDTPSVYYSLSYKLQDWSRFYPSSDEYRDYLERFAEEFGIDQHTVFGATVESLRWHEDRNLWEVVYRRGEERVSHFANVVVTAFGYLNDPKYPDLPGKDSFRGRAFHTADWQHDVDLSDKRVAVVGTGASAVQVVDALAGKVGSFHLFQRQPTWILPDLVGKSAVPPQERWLVASVPFYNEWLRAKQFWFSGDAVQYPRIFVDEAWHAEHPMSISEANDATLQMCLEHIHDTFGEGSDLARMVTPDFPPNSKRNVRDPGDFYPSIARGDVILDDTAITGLVPEGVELADGRVVPLDVIVYATGFHLRYLSDIRVEGRGGAVLTDQWGDNPKAYTGGTVHGFPNLFITCPPNGGVNHGGSHNFATEIGVQYVTECLRLMFERDSETIEVKEDVVEDYAARIDKDLEKTIWGLTTNAHTYYRNSAGRMTLPNPWPLVDLWHMHATPNEEAYDLRTSRS